MCKRTWSIRIVRALVLVLTGLSVLGCGDDEPDASDTLVAIIEQARDGHVQDVWDAIHPHQQPLIDAAAFASCLASNPPPDGDIAVVDTHDSDVLVHDERFDVTSVVLTTESDVSDFQGTYMLTKIDGQWRWVWQNDWIAILNGGECPELWPSS